MTSPSRLVLDSSVAIAAVQSAEPEHEAARGFLARFRRAAASRTSLFAPPELWLEVHVVERRLARSRRQTVRPGDALADLAIELCPTPSLDELERFLAHLDQRMRGRPPFANATDLVYLWAAWRLQATVVTLDRGLLSHHQLVCDVMHPRHLLRDA